MKVLRYAAFTTDSLGGNPAGVVLDATGMSDADMASIAKDVGYSETAFVVPGDDGRMTVRYFSPAVEVPFCGHATIATAVAHAHLHGVGELTLHTRAGVIPVHTGRDDAGRVTATLTSVPPRTEPMTDDQVAALLRVLGWKAEELDRTMPPRVAYAGAWHPVLAAADRARLAALDYDMRELAALMDRHGWVTVNLVWRESPVVFHSRNPFPTGGVFEDPATGAAAAAFGGYLREANLVPLPARITIRQGDDMGRPSTITATIPKDPDAGIAITGTAVEIEHPVAPAPMR
ncbi:PhzF family phenazine biosynthesis protein [Streptomyces viridosporus]|uniref:PhzF family phenazine biosynthesis protein n=1 Tax=Streptomyces viridosporus TaxID=67581 RepID=UPI0009BDD960|nr:PhzF family phenazine biosynthesis isomerase [Streptomyces viridosporus]